MVIPKYYLLQVDVPVIVMKMAIHVSLNNYKGSDAYYSFATATLLCTLIQVHML